MTNSERLDPAGIVSSEALQSYLIKLQQELINKKGVGEVAPTEEDFKKKYVLYVVRRSALDVNNVPWSEIPVSLKTVLEGFFGKENTNSADNVHIHYEYGTVRFQVESPQLGVSNGFIIDHLNGYATQGVMLALLEGLYTEGLKDRWVLPKMRLREFVHAGSAIQEYWETGNPEKIGAYIASDHPEQPMITSKIAEPQHFQDTASLIDKITANARLVPVS